jgi:hypothetical protein
LPVAIDGFGIATGIPAGNKHAANAATVRTANAAGPGCCVIGFLRFVMGALPGVPANRTKES